MTAPPAVYNMVSMTPAPHGYTAMLQASSPDGVFGPAVQQLRVEITFESADRCHIKITDAHKARWEVPEDVLPTPGVDPEVDRQRLNYALSYTWSPASLAVTRLADGAVLFNSSSLAFEEQFVQLSTPLAGPNANVYGLGEHVKRFRLDTNHHSYTLWAADVPTPVDQNLYGSHPFLLELRPNGNAHGVFLRNSNGMDVVLGGGAATFKAVGGVLDLYVLAGPAPELVVRQYHAVIGRPYLPPFWTLGFHQCKYGYPNIGWLKDVVAQFKAHAIPLDTIYSDIDYMYQFEDFTFDPERYPVHEVRAFVDQLHRDGQRYVTIVDPGIHTRPGYAPYEEGLRDGIFITTRDGVTPFVGTVWPGPTVFPDFLHPKAEQYWERQFASFFDAVPVDGIWIDMNEISNFGDGAADAAAPRARPGAADVNNPPYRINNFNWRAPLNTKTLAMDALHYGNVTEYDAHNLYGLTEAIATRRVLERRYNRRAFVLSRSTFPGAGAHASHWLGDNYATWESMRYSIAGVLDFNLFGIPLVGPDVCGFIGETSEELCARWTALGSFYPFSRNHADINSKPQEPYVWETVARAARKTLAARYSLLPYLYTQLADVAARGGTFARALFFEFPLDANTYAIDQQFLLGPALLVSPVLHEGATAVTAYFPYARWYSFWNGSELAGAPGTRTLETPLDHIQLHVRGGHVVPLQAPALTTEATRRNPFKLLVALDRDGLAAGRLFWDDGESLDVGKAALRTAYAVANSTLSARVEQDTFVAAIPPLDVVTVLGVERVGAVTVNGVPHTNAVYDAANRCLDIKGLTLPMNKPFSMAWS